jgi:hypothetical protein
VKRFGIALLMIAAMLGGAAFYYSCPDHRYRLTIEIDTPEGVKSGSSVIAVYASDVKWGLPEAKGFRSRITGEAVFVDLGSGRNVIALLAHGKGAERNKMDFLAQAAFARAGLKVEWSEAKNLKGSAVLTGELVPTMVRFSNLDDPSTAKVVYATESYEVRDGQGRYIGKNDRVAIDEFEAAFGLGYRFKRAWIEITRSKITKGIEKTVPWIGNYAQETIFEKKLGETGSNGVLAPGQNLKRG